MIHYLKASLFLLISSILTISLNQPWGVVPALGRLVSPFEGFWQNAESKMDKIEESLSIHELTDEVTVLYDDRHIPHIFAKNEHDAYLAQGYVTARDRLWQMEFQTHAAAGRISEIVGERALELDRYNRRLGMGYGAERALKAILADPITREMVEAYTMGVNAYIERLKPAMYPIEYKLLGYAPERWSPLKTALLFKQMTQTLAAGADDLMMSAIRQKHGPIVTANLFPDYPFREDPIIPPGTAWDFTPLKPPLPPLETTYKGNVIGFHRQHHDPSIGSNNWAVSAAKSATGYPILANDPHLTLSLPSIWYQVQLVTPTQNVYGVSLPGSPGVIIGFNNNVAWGMTNVGADVLDFYKIQFRDSHRLEYLYDGHWKPVRRRIETILIKGKPALQDTVLYTHHGPIVYVSGEKPLRTNIPIGFAARWIAHEPDNSLKAIQKMNRAENYTDYKNALTHYIAPAQNFIFADQNDIAISTTGRFPLKWRNQGKFLLDGTQSTHDWQAWIPSAHNPRVVNPRRGFVSSANQFPTDPTYPYYLNWEFAPSERAIRINQRLAKMQGATTDSLRQLQNDVYNLSAATFLPVLLPHLNKKQLKSSQKQAVNILSRWNYEQDTASIGATVFTEWITTLSQAIWEDDFPHAGSGDMPMRFPSLDRTFQLISQEPNSPWFDDLGTPNQRETLSDLINSSFRATVDTLERKNGPLGVTWAWGRHKSTSIRHLIPGLDAFSALNIQIGGGNSIVNAAGSRSGPSWRMVVALGPRPKGFGIYPGGQSGNPGSPYYLNLLETWRKGELDELLFLQSPTEKSSHLSSTLKLTHAR